MTDAQIITAIADIADNTPNTALEIRTLFTELFNRGDKSGTIKIKDCSNAYITANFDGTGLGINEELGYAICNGQNGTRNWNGRVPVAYGTSYSTMGAAEGSKDAVVVSHVHYTVANGAVQGNFDSSKKYIGKDRNSGVNVEYNLQGTVLVPTLGETTSSGVDGTNMNMQPYIVTLVTMKL